MGYLDHGNQEMEAALRLARELDHIPTVIHALWCAAELYQVRREPHKVEESTEYPSSASVTARLCRELGKCGDAARLG